MIERFSVGAQRVLALAQEESRFLGHQQCGCEHLFLGLIRDPGIAGQRLNAQGQSLDSARRAVVEIQGRYPAGRSIEGATLPFSANAKKALALAVEAADQADSAKVETDFMLTGLLQGDSTILAAVLAAIPGVTAPTLRDSSE